MTSPSTTAFSHPLRILSSLLSGTGTTLARISLIYAMSVSRLSFTFGLAARLFYFFYSTGCRCPLLFFSLNQVSRHPHDYHQYRFLTDPLQSFRGRVTNPLNRWSLYDYALSDSPRWDTCQARNRVYACCYNWLKVCRRPF